MNIWEIEHAHEIIDGMKHEKRIIIQSKHDGHNLPLDTVGVLRHYNWTEDQQVGNALADHTEWYVRITWSTGWDQFVKFTVLMDMLFFNACVIRA